MRNSSAGSTFGQTVHSGTLLSGDTASPCTTPVIQMTMKVSTYTAAQSATRVAAWNVGAAQAAAMGTTSSAAP